MNYTGATVVTCADERIDVECDADRMVFFETDRGKVYEIRFEEDTK
jgi:hypothetical protein